MSVHLKIDLQQSFGVFDWSELEQTELWRSQQGSHRTESPPLTTDHITDGDFSHVTLSSSEAELKESNQS